MKLAIIKRRLTQAIFWLKQDQQTDPRQVKHVSIPNPESI